MKIIVLIVLFLMIGGLAMDCRNNGTTSLSSCRSNPSIRIEKIRGEDSRNGGGGGIKSYKISLNSGINDRWIVDNEWIECSDLCSVCQSLPTSEATKVCPDDECEQKVDRFLNSFCESAILTTSTNTIRTIIVTQGRTLTSTTTETVTPTLSIITVVSTALVTVAPTCTTRINTDAPICHATTTTIADPLCVQKFSTLDPGGISGPTQKIDSETSTNTSTHQAPVIALGILAGLFFIALVAVIIGWMWTCWTIKRRGGMDISSKNTTVGTSINEDERYFENPTYEETSTRLSDSVSNEASENVNSSSTTYNTTHENGEDGPAYDVLSRAQATDHRRGRVVPNLPGGEDYSRLGLCDNDLEKNYQLLGKGFKGQ